MMKAGYNSSLFCPARTMNLPVFDDIPIGVCVLKRGRKELVCLYANAALKSLIGTDPLGKDIESFWPSEDIRDLARKLRGPVPPLNATLSLERDRRKSWVLLSIQETRHGEDDSYTIWAADISASKEAEEKMRLAVQQADAASEQKSNFLATISHEIRTPMQSVYGLLEMIELESPPPNILTMARTARDSASGLLEILDDVLDFAKMDAEQMELDYFEVPLRTLARGLLEAMAVKVSGKSVILKDDIADDVPFVIVGDPKRLRQILVNLMGNAMKFTKNGSITIRISRNARHIPAPAHGLALRFEIADTGIGMGPETASRLFRPFSQADNSTSRKYGGTGLGLSICKKLVEMMGGRIGVDSEEGEGSTFWFEIPTEEVSTDANILTLPSLDGVSVLSVEDHPMGAKEIVKSLRSMGATVESCATIEEARALVKRRPFDVGVIDQGLPDGLGLDLIREIMELRPFMGLVMYTVRDDAGLQHSLQSLGVTYLAKPASRIGLGEAVQDAAVKNSYIQTSGPRKLLIAEDTASVQDVLRRQLHTLGIEASFVQNGREALYAVRSGEYGILITDLHMPEIDGFGVVQAVREDDAALERHFPVIVLTADVQMAQRQIYMGHGFDECLLKPVSLGQLRRLLTRWGLLNGEAATTMAAPATVAAPHALPVTDSDKGEEDAAIKEEISLEPALDREAIIEQMGAFDDDVADMLKAFIGMTAPLLTRIQTAWGERDYSDLAEAGHSLKGAARSACLNRLGDAASLLQDKAQDKQDCTAIVTQIENEFSRAKAEIEKL
ncbi:MAG: response regulator [Micavibrio sp.]